ncbi:MAG: restriction endonuclease subunit S [Nitrospirae bacterium]|nr:restriction endonuclease subunit S [Nitrospirota bacterium]
MSNWNNTPFAKLLVDSKDGEWGDGEETVGSRESIIIRGTDFADLDNPAVDFPKRWIKNHIADRKCLQPGDIILETAGGTSTQSTGRSALLKKSFFDHHSDFPVLCASFSRHLRLDTSKYSPRFIYYLLQTLYRTGYMAVFNIQHTGVSRFQYTSFRNHTELQIPELPFQRKISAILSTYDELIEKNKRRIALLEKLAEEIYREWFVRLRFPGHESVKLVKGVPGGWEVRTLGSFASEIKKGIKKQDLLDNEKYLGLEHIPRRSIAITEWATADTVDSNKLLFKERDILFGKIRPYLHKVALAHFSGACSSDTIVIRPKENIYEGYLLFTVFSDTFIELAHVSSKGTKMPRADWSFLKKLKLSVPDTKLLEKYQSHFDTFFSEIVNLLRANEVLTASRDRLLLRLTSGKLPVKHLDIKFPPSMAEELIPDSTASAYA